MHISEEREVIDSKLISDNNKGMSCLLNNEDKKRKWKELAHDYIAMQVLR